jgi:hypothetical protein
MSRSLAHLVTLLDRVGYFQNYLTYGDGNLRSWDWERTGQHMAGAGKLAWNTFLCGKSTDRARLEKFVPGDLIDKCLGYGLCQQRGTRLSFGATALVACDLFHFFFDRGFPSRAYFGDDSRALMSLTPRLGEGAALCLYSGAGAEALPLGMAEGVELAIETGDTGRDFVKANLELNGISPRARLLNRTDSHGHAAYDVIVARVPCMIEPEGLTLPALASGGTDGRRELERTLKLAAEHLSAEGVLRFVGCLYGGDDSAALAKSLKSLLAAHRLSGELTLMTKLHLEPGVPVFNQIFAYAEHGSRLPRGELFDRVVEHIKRLGYTDAYLVKGICRRAVAARTTAVVDLSAQYYGSWTL